MGSELLLLLLLWVTAAVPLLTTDASLTETPMALAYRRRDIISLAACGLRLETKAKISHGCKLLQVARWLCLVGNLIHRNQY